MAFWNHCGGMKEFFLYGGGRLGDMVMHVLRKLYRERCPGAHRLCAVVHGLLHWRSSVRRLGWQNAESTVPAKFRNLVLDAIPGDFCVGGKLARASLCKDRKCGDWTA